MAADSNMTVPSGNASAGTLPVGFVARNRSMSAGSRPTQIRSYGAPISSSATCTASEPDPGHPYNL